MNPEFSPLFEPFECGSLKVKNRIAMAPMTRSHSPGGLPTREVSEYYARRALGGVGLIISEGVAIDRPGSVDSEFIPRFHGEKPLAAWGDIAQAVHDAGAAIGPQLWHVGGAPRAAHHPGEWPGEPESPSGLFSPTVPSGRPMSEEDIADTIAAYAKAGAAARRLGFDCLEFHGAHGYLFDQFYWDGSNRREDRFGGKDLRARTAFATEVIKATRQAVGPDFTLILRFSQWKLHDFGMKLAKTPAEMEAWLCPLADAGIDMFDGSQRRFWEPEFEGSDLNLAGWAKKVTGKPSITVGSVGLKVDLLSGGVKGPDIESDISRLRDLVRRLDRGEFDMVAVGRALLANSDWTEKVREGRYSDLRDYKAEHRQVLT